ncbi:MAG: hypothetical protein E7260_00965 [Lachnospiraceae bacterium]|nr:hypothetical protein [Lachnospiraceae bacterium]
MKKNILAIVILAATIVNITLSAIMLFTVVPKAQRTDALIQKIVAILNLELENPDASDYAEIPFEDRETYAITERQTINLSRIEGDSKNRYAFVYITLLINNKSDDYKTIQPKLAEYERIVISKVSDQVSTYTIETIIGSKEEICDKVLEALRTEFGSADFLIDVDLNIAYE